ncbi:MAG: Mannosyltransferase [Pseudomonadota bacterium]
MLKSRPNWQPLIILLCWGATLLWFFKILGGLHSYADFLAATEWLDVGWYKAIAYRGYYIDPSMADGQSTVFFPLFPLLAAPFVHFFSLDSLLALHLVQKLALVGMGYCAFNWAKQVGFSPQESLLALLLHPALVFLFIPYTESLYLFCFFGLLLAWNKKNSLAFFGLSYLLGLCRPTGLFLIPAAAITLPVLALQVLRSSSQPVSPSISILRTLWYEPEFKKSTQMLVLGVAGAVAALLSIAIIMHLSVGDWYAFYRYRILWKEEPGFRNILSFLNLDFGQNTSRILVSWAAFWGCWLLFKSKRIFEGALCLLAILLPAYQGKMGDIIRYSMGAAPAWMILVERYKNSRLWLITFIAFSSALGFHFLVRWVARVWPG